MVEFLPMLDKRVQGVSREIQIVSFETGLQKEGILPEIVSQTETPYRRTRTDPLRDPYPGRSRGWASGILIRLAVPEIVKRVCGDDGRGTAGLTFLSSYR